jgi:tetratricopeptide (TPR) repeat protein
MLAAALAAQGQFRRAENLLRCSESVLVSNLGATHLEVAAVRRSLGSVYLEQGRLALAESELLSALRIWERLLGPESPSYIHTANLLIRLQCSAQEFRSAARLLDRILPLAVEIFGPDHPETARIFLNQALLESGRGNFEQAQSAARRAIEIQATRMPDSRTELLNSVDFYQGLMRRVGDAPTARRMGRWAKLIKAAGPDRPFSPYVRRSCEAFSGRSRVSR